MLYMLRADRLLELKLENLPDDILEDFFGAANSAQFTRLSFRRFSVEPVKLFISKCSQLEHLSIFCASWDFFKVVCSWWKSDVFPRLTHMEASFYSADSGDSLPIKEDMKRIFSDSAVSVEGLSLKIYGANFLGHVLDRFDSHPASLDELCLALYGAPSRVFSFEPDPIAKRLKDSLIHMHCDLVETKFQSIFDLFFGVEPFSDRAALLLQCFAYYMTYNPSGPMWEINGSVALKWLAKKIELFSEPVRRFPLWALLYAAQFRLRRDKPPGTYAGDDLERSGSVLRDALRLDLETNFRELLPHMYYDRADFLLPIWKNRETYLSLTPAGGLYCGLPLWEHANSGDLARLQRALESGIIDPTIKEANSSFDLFDDLVRQANAAILGSRFPPMAARFICDWLALYGSSEQVEHLRARVWNYITTERFIRLESPRNPDFSNLDPQPSTIDSPFAESIRTTLGSSFWQAKRTDPTPLPRNLLRFFFTGDPYDPHKSDSDNAHYLSLIVLHFRALLDLPRMLPESKEEVMHHVGDLSDHKRAVKIVLLAVQRLWAVENPQRAPHEKSCVLS